MDTLTNPSPTQDVGNNRSAISDGADLGAKIGCLLSTLYSLLGFLGILIFMVTLAGTFDMLAGTVFLAAGPTLIFYMLTLVPVLLLGGLTGAILGWLSKKLSGVVPKSRFFQIGMLVCDILLVILHAAFFALSPVIMAEDSVPQNVTNDNYSTEPLIPLTPAQSYLIFIGVPSIIYVTAGGWVSHKLSLRMQDFLAL